MTLETKIEIITEYGFGGIYANSTQKYAYVELNICVNINASFVNKSPSATFIAFLESGRKRRGPGSPGGMFGCLRRSGLREVVGGGRGQGEMFGCIKSIGLREVVGKGGGQGDVWLYEEKRAQGGCRRKRGPGGMFGCIRRSGLREVVGGGVQGGCLVV